MPDRSIIPRDIKEFDNFINSTNLYLLLSTLVGNPAVSVLNYVRYNWTSGLIGQLTNNLADWQAFLARWQPLHAKYIDKKGGYTTNVKNDLLIIIAEVVKYAHENKLIELIKATVYLTSADCSAWRLPEDLAAPGGTHLPGTHHGTVAASTDRTAPTKEGVYARLIAELNGLVHIKAFSEATESGRSHKLHGFDEVEFMAGVFYNNNPNLPTSETDARLIKGHSTKTNFLLATAGMTANLPTLPVGTVPPAKVLIIFFRWAKSKHPNLDGPWSVLYTIVLR
ncbi:MAG: hypothetical protein ACYDCN_00215 [Bacteroidia bacterium]